jgi:hypothetical protein
MSEKPDEGREAPRGLAPADFFDPVIEAYKKDVDRTLLRENLKLTVEERIRKAESFHKSSARLRGAARQGPLVDKASDRDTIRKQCERAIADYYEPTES